MNLLVYITRKYGLCHSLSLQYAYQINIGHFLLFLSKIQYVMILWSSKFQSVREKPHYFCCQPPFLGSSNWPGLNLVVFRKHVHMVKADHSYTMKHGLTFMVITLVVLMSFMCHQHRVDVVSIYHPHKDDMVSTCMIEAKTLMHHHRCGYNFGGTSALTHQWTATAFFFSFTYAIV